MRLLLIDNYDSFTFNLVQYFKELDCDITVVRNDEMTISEIAESSPDLIVLSPGPCSPNESGICLSVVEHFAGKIPLLGVCLGHQVIAQSFGGRVIRAKKVMHGKVSEVTHSGHEMFDGIPEKFSVTRYHSLLVSADKLPEGFEITAACQKADNKPTGLGSGHQNHTEIMALAHKNQPIWGVQFHPESHLTEFGHRLLANVVKLSVS